MTELNARVEQINRDEKEDKVTRIAAIAATRSEIVDYLEKAMAQKPEISESARMYLGNYNYIAGNIDKAIELYEALISDFASSDQIGSYQTFLKEIKEEKSNREKAAKQVIKTGKKK
jgi:tetratricopeptide (TPR) repeat protein